MKVFNTLRKIFKKKDRFVYCTQCKNFKGKCQVVRNTALFCLEGERFIPKKVHFFHQP